MGWFQEFPMLLTNQQTAELKQFGKKALLTTLKLLSSTRLDENQSVIATMRFARAMGDCASLQGDSFPQVGSISSSLSA